MLTRLEAHDAARNIHRRYEIARSPDLFGWTLIELRWGRVGAEMRAKVLATPTPEAADKLVRQVMHRRAGARKRIGVAYREVSR
jgi:predicted DNA-binding WGR domain protein